MARIRVVARVGLDNPALPPFVVISILAHVGFVVALLFMPSLRGERQLLPDVLPVELVALAPAPREPPTRPAPAQPAPPRPSAPSKTEALPENPPPERKPPPDKPKDEPRPERRPAASRPIEPASSRPVDADPPTGGTEPPEGLEGPEGPEAEVTALSGIDVEFAWYAASVKNRLFSNWRRPILQRVAEPYEATVAFDILRDGRVSNLRVLQGSGVPSMDRSALRAVADASPLPPLPQGWREPLLPATFVFRLYPES